MVNENVAREIYNQGKERLQDLLETKKSFDQKAFVLMTGYIALSTAFLGICSTYINNNSLLAWSFGLVGAGFFTSSLLVIFSLIGRKYASLGSDPNMWLTDDYKKGGDETIAYMLLYLSEFYQERISVSRKSSEKASRIINIAILVGAISPLLSLIPLIKTF